MKSFAALAAGLLFAAPALAEVKSATPAGFEVQSRAVIKAIPSDAWFLLGQPRQWWSPGHTYSGASANLSLEKRAGGCFCESVPATGATIEHGRVVYAEPNKLLRIDGALGPLQAEAATGTLTWTLKEVPGGTEVTQTYVVGGYIRGGAQKLAPMVDKVMAEQLEGLRNRAANGPGFRAKPVNSPTG